MLEEYNNEFREMYRRISNGEKPLEVVEEYLPKFEKKGIGRLGIAHYLIRLIEEDY